MKIPAWSYSSIKLFDQCPKKYYHLRVVKDVVEPETEAMLYGTRFHEAAEFYVKDGTPIPPQFSFAQQAIDNLNKIQGEKLCEFEMGLNENLEPCGFKTPETWCRGIADLVIIDHDKAEARVVDYKTGKSAKYADMAQLELMALHIFKYFPNIKRVKAALLFVVCGAFIKGSYESQNQDKMWSKWLAEFNRLKLAYKNDVWNPRPSGLCRRHCSVLQCPHNGRN
jgi:hypothetical protein